jgi:tRNA-splicing ligase RtcB
MTINGLRRIDENKIEVIQGFKKGMLTNGIIYLDERLEKNLEIKAIEQVANVASLPGIVGPSLAMPDVHTGYGFTIGGVAAFDLNNGIISPGGVGYDINCGVRLITTKMEKSDIIPHITELVENLYNRIPTGVGSKGNIKLNTEDKKNVIRKGSRWALEQGLGTHEDLEHTESGGCIEGADPDVISKEAYDRGSEQLGTLGAGNHFAEVQYVDKIYDQAAAASMGLFKDQVTLMIHTGSRGFGHQVCTDFLEIMNKASKKYNIVLPDRELACAPIDSPEARKYIAAMKAAANYAWANRQIIMRHGEEAFMQTLKTGPANIGMRLVYDAKIEEHIIDNKKRRLLVHRKGATRAFPAGHPDLPDAYKKTGQPVIIPGDMGRASYVLLGAENSMLSSFGSTCHGAGRLMSRNRAIKTARGRAIRTEMEVSGVTVRASGRNTLAEEMPEAYKNITDVVNVVHNAGLSRKVARLKPLGVIKG